MPNNKYVKIDNTHKKPANVLVCVCWDDGKWVVRYVPEYGGLATPLKMIMLALATAADQCKILFVESGSTVWIEVDKDGNTRIHQKEPSDAGSMTIVAPLDPHKDFNLVTLSHGGFHFVCQCGDSWEVCEEGETPANCCD